VIIRTPNFLRVPVDSNVSQATWRDVGASDFMLQLNRIEEAQRIIDLAWTAGVFEECVGPATTKRIQSLEKLAYEVLADQYEDVRIMVRSPAHPFPHRSCWIKVLAANGVK
jgi:hypothetical protein